MQKIAFLLLIQFLLGGSLRASQENLQGFEYRACHKTCFEVKAHQALKSHFADYYVLVGEVKLTHLSKGKAVSYKAESAYFDPTRSSFIFQRKEGDLIVEVFRDEIIEL